MFLCQVAFRSRNSSPDTDNDSAPASANLDNVLMMMITIILIINYKYMFIEHLLTKKQPWSLITNIKLLLSFLLQSVLL